VQIAAQADEFRRLTHVEIQYIFATVLIHESEAELRELLFQSGLLTQDSAPYNFKFHQFLYLHLWGIEVGDPTRARRLAFRPKRSAQVRASAAIAPLAGLLAKYSISPPIRPEGLHHPSPAPGNSAAEDDELQTSRHTPTSEV
jgi:hypothetical protein